MEFFFILFYKCENAGTKNCMGYVQCMSNNPLNSFNRFVAAVDPCPTGWTPSDNRCFRLYYSAKEFSDAQAYCQGQYGDLARAKPPSVNVSIYIWFVNGFSYTVFISNL